MYKFYIGGELLPVAPEKLTTKINNQNKTVTMINEGEVNLIKSPGLTEISFDFCIPVLQTYPFATYPSGKFKKPKYYLDLLEGWKTSKQEVQFAVTRQSPNKKKTLFSTSMKVTIEEYSIVEDAADGGDLTVSVTLKQYKKIAVKKLVVKKKSGEKTVTAKRTSSGPKSKTTKSKTYTVRSGDTLILIAKKKLGSTAKWKTLYNLNKSTIEKAAKQHGRKSSSYGRYIYPGTVLRLQ